MRADDWLKPGPGCMGTLSASPWRHHTTRGDVQQANEWDTLSGSGLGCDMGGTRLPEMRFPPFRPYKRIQNSRPHASKRRAARSCLRTQALHLVPHYPSCTSPACKGCHVPGTPPLLDALLIALLLYCTMGHLIYAAPQ